ncbi:hypothetical protein C8R45DRAFT_937183 [Mycena sanguinolenta]|nr:hypothetical protein C8R45DRAFT_937183 [Mycena sanguinolenta]
MIIEATALVLFMYGRKAFYLTLRAFIWVEKMCWPLWNKIIRKSVIRWCVHCCKPCKDGKSRGDVYTFVPGRVQPLRSIQVNESLIPMPTSDMSPNVPGPPIHPKRHPRPKRPSSQSAFAFKPSSNSAFALVLAWEAAEDNRLLARLGETPELVSLHKHCWLRGMNIYLMKALDVPVGGKPELCRQESRSMLGDRKPDGASMDVDGDGELEAGMDLDKADVDPFVGLSAEELENMTAEE